MIFCQCDVKQKMIELTASRLSPPRTKLAVILENFGKNSYLSSRLGSTLEHYQGRFQKFFLSKLVD